jgi:integrase
MIIEQMERQGVETSTRTNHANRLKHLVKNCDLNNPKQVELFIAKKKSGHYKELLATSYQYFCTYKKIAWTMPTYTTDEHMPKLPTTEQVNKLIIGAGKTLSLKLRLSMETGLRPCELMELQTKDIDTVSKLVYPRTHKHGSARILKISENLAQALQKYAIKKDLQPTDRLFKGNIDPIKGSKKYGQAYREMRKTLAKKLNDSTLLTVRLYDLRHYFLTYDYIKLRDVGLTAQDAGHKDWNTTRKYIHLARVMELIENSDECITKTATTVKECQELIEHGFTKADEVTENGITIHIYKKRK